MDILEGTSLAFGRRAWGFLVGALGIGVAWAAATGNLRSGPPLPVALIAFAAALCGFAALFMPRRLTVPYWSTLAAGVLALATTGFLIAMG